MNVRSGLVLISLCAAACDLDPLVVEQPPTKLADFVLRPSNFKPEDMASFLPVARVSGLETCVIDTEKLTLSGCGVADTQLVAYEQSSTATLSDSDRQSREVALWSLARLEIDFGGRLEVSGSRALVIAVRGDVVIDGEIFAGARGSESAGPGAKAGKECAGAEGRRGKDATVDKPVAMGGGGAGHASVGGYSGGRTSSSEFSVSEVGRDLSVEELMNLDLSDPESWYLIMGVVGGGRTRNNARLIPLGGGCSGGEGGNQGDGGMGGLGGGAIQISAAGTFHVRGRLVVSGGGGQGGKLGRGGGGGGSGGALLLEGKEVFIEDGASLGARGGGGGQGGLSSTPESMRPGSDGDLTEMATGPVPGGGLAFNTGSGGHGGFGDLDERCQLKGPSSEPLPDPTIGGIPEATAFLDCSLLGMGGDGSIRSGGGGGGAAGRIRINGVRCVFDQRAVIQPNLTENEGLGCAQVERP